MVDIPIIDAEYYHTWAASLASGRGGEEGTYFMSPLYPYLLSILYSLLTPSLKLVLIFQAIMGIILIYLTYKIGTILFNRTTGLVCALLTAFYRPFIYYEGVLLTATLILLLNAVILLILLKQSRRGWVDIIAGILLGLSALARPNILLFALMLIAVFLIIPSKRDFRRAVFIVLGLAIVLIPTSYRNFRAGGEWVLTTAGAGMNFFAGNNPDAEGIYWEAPFITSAEPWYENEDFRREASLHTGRNLTINESSHYWLGQGLAYITDQPLHYMQLLLKKLFLFFHSTEIPNNLSIYAAIQFSNLLLYIPFTFAFIAPIGFVSWVLNWRESKMFIPNVYGIAYLASTLIFFAASEYRLPVLLVLLPLFSAGIVQFIRYLRESQWKSAGKFVLLVILFAVPVNMSTGFTDNLQSSRMDYFNLGSVLQKQRRFDEAAGMFQHALFIDPEFVEAHRALADSYHALCLREEAAEEFIRAGINPEPELILLDAENLLYAAQTKAQLGDHIGALESYDEALNIHPDPPAYAYYNMAYLNLQMGDIARALDEAQIAASIDPNEARISYLQGWICENRGWWDKALEHYLKALEDNPTLHEARVRAALVYIERGENKKAAKMIEPIIGIELNSRELTAQVIEIAGIVGY